MRGVREMKRTIVVLMIVFGIIGIMHYTAPIQPKYEPVKAPQVVQEKAKPKPQKKKVVKKPVSKPVIKPTPQPKTTPKPVSGTGIIRLVNQVRVKHGLPSLIESSSLNRSATLSAQGQASTGTCCSHGNWTQWFSKAGANYSYKGENIAACQVSDQQVVNAWVNSPPHLENILSRQFRYAGVGKVSGNFKGQFSSGRVMKCIYYSNHFGW